MLLLFCFKPSCDGVYVLQFQVFCLVRIEKNTNVWNCWQNVFSGAGWIYTVTFGCCFVCFWQSIIKNCTLECRVVGIIHFKMCIIYFSWIKLHWLWQHLSLKVYSCFSATLGTLEFALLYDSANNALHCTIVKARVSFWAWTDFSPTMIVNPYS